MCYSPLLLMFYSSLLLSFEQVKVYRDYSVGDQTGGDVMGFSSDGAFRYLGP